MSTTERCRDQGVLIKKVRQLRRVDRLEAHVVQAIHKLPEVAATDVLRVACAGFPLLDAVEHDDQNDGSGRGVRGGPSVVQILALVLNVGVRRDERIQNAAAEDSREGQAVSAERSA